MIDDSMNDDLIFDDLKNITIRKMSMPSTMFVVVTSLWMVIAQPLNSIQHSALMDVYNGLGCNATACPRFASTENCIAPASCSGGNVLDLNAFYKQLTGTISSSIILLTALTKLSLYNNQLSGTLTSYVGQLTALNLLSLHTNQFNGTIPKEIAQLKALTYLELQTNQFSGTFPIQITQLTALDALYLSNNQFTGTIPIQIAQLTALGYLHLYNNRLTGPIPPLSSTFSRCNLQTSSDTNCLDCSTAPSMCMADCFPRTCPPKPMASTTTPAPTTQQTSSSTITSMSGGMSTSSMIVTTIQTTSGHNRPTTITTTVIGMSTTQQSDDNIALIGGIVGGVVALLLVVGVIAFIMSRNRHHAQDQPSNRSDVSMVPTQAPSSNYGKINVQPASNVYDESFLKHSLATQNYDDAGVLANNNYGIANANANADQTNYDDPSVLMSR